MTYRESLAWLYATQQFGIKLGLANTQRLLESEGNPHDGLRIVHVAGTNGKGSVCAMLDSIFRAAGFRTGLYTSPHLIDFRERIQVGRVWIGREEVASGLTRLRAACAGWEHAPTFFEIATVLALRHFADAGCGIVVLETGMGGRLDATNVVDPAISVITPIAIDHAEWLGDTIAKIAAEKAGIIKTGVPVVSAPQLPEAAEVLRARAARCGSRITFAGEAWPQPPALAGEHQRWNAAVAALAARELGIAEEHIARGLGTVVWNARFQRVGDSFIVDGAHNPHAIATLVQTWKSAYPRDKAVVIFGAMEDKDFTGMIRLLEEIACEFRFVPVASARAASVDRFRNLTQVPARSFNDLAGALAAGGGSPVPVLITGSLFLAGEALAAIGDPSAS